MSEHYVPFDLLQAEFEALFIEFVKAGGLVSTRCISEDYERVYRQTALCKHARVWKECEVCYKPPKPYFPADHK